MRSLTVSRPAVTGRSMMLIGVMAVAVLWSGQIVAAQKTDVVVLINGDRITGEVKDLERGILKYSTDFMGTLSIEWDKVVQLRSDQLLEVELLDGTRTLGRPKQLDERGAMRLQADGDETVVSLESVSRIFAIDTGRLRDRLDGYGRVGWSAAAANDVSQLSVGAGLTYIDPIRLWDFDYEYSRSDSGTSSPSESQTLKIDQLRFLRDQWFWTGGGNISTNDELGLDLRVLLGGGVGRYFLQTPSQEFFAAAGVGVSKEEFADGQTQESFEGILAMSYDLYKFDSPEIDISMELTVYPSFTVSGRVRTDAGIRMRYEIIDDLFYELSAQHMYDNEPQSVGATNSDWSVVTSLGYSF
jgi:putative salt-induced outer membrane protein YdiY